MRALGPKRRAGDSLGAATPSPRADKRSVSLPLPGVPPASCAASGPGAEEPLPEVLSASGRLPTISRRRCSRTWGAAGAGGDGVRSMRRSLRKMLSPGGKQEPQGAVYQGVENGTDGRKDSLKVP